MDFIALNYFGTKINYTDFFKYVMATAKGTKMPRGDKAAIMKYEVPVFTFEEQKKIAGVLEGLDRKIQIIVNDINNFTLK